MLTLFGSSVLTLGITGIVILNAGLLVCYIMAHCPECGALLGRSPGRFCKSCGKEFDWDQISRF